MPLPPGTQLGNYQIVAQIGTGGMGEVYKAHDPKLDRFVAVKLLPEHLAGNPNFLARFQMEAKAVAALNHSSLIGIHDFGQEGGHFYAVMELLEGETFRACLSRGPLGPRKVTELAIQVAQGMAVAHDKGIIHRDLKPDNLWITRDNKVKILDFGLAKRNQPPEIPQNHQPFVPETVALGPLTEMGTVLGTVGYMSPEQVRGEVVDTRSDIFSLGVVLYEMLSGQRPFKGDTPVQTMNAILETDPEDLQIAKGTLPPALGRIVMRCLEKRLENRFQSMRDLAYSLGQASSLSGSSPSLGNAKKAGKSRWVIARSGLAAALILGAGMAGWHLKPTAPAAPVFTPLTFSGAPVWAARFTQDGRSVVFTQGSTRIGETRVQALNLDHTPPHDILEGGCALLGLSRSNELATIHGLYYAQFRDDTFVGTLGRSPLDGTLPRTLSARVVAADWSPDGKGLAVVRDLGPGGMQVEFPEGKVLAKVDGGWFSHIRFSPDGRHLAVIKHPIPIDDGGMVILLDPESGPSRELGKPWGRLLGLAWRADGREIWFTGGDQNNRQLRAMALDGKVRTVASVPADLNVEDIAPDGRVLLTSGDFRWRLFSWEEGSREIVPMTIQEVSFLESISLDGRQVVVNQDDAGAEHPLFLRTTDGIRTTSLGTGLTALVMPEAGKVFIVRGSRPAPTGVLLDLLNGHEEPFQMGPLAYQPRCLAASRKGEVILLQHDGSAQTQLWRVSARQPPVPLTPPLSELFSRFHLRGPLGRRVLLRKDQGAVCWVDLEDPKCDVHPVEGLDKRDVVVGTSLDDQWFYVACGLDLPMKIDRVHFLTGKREPFKRIDIPGVKGRISSINLSPDGMRMNGQTDELTYQLFLAEGLK